MFSKTIYFLIKKGYITARLVGAYSEISTETKVAFIDNGTAVAIGEEVNQANDKYNSDIELQKKYGGFTIRDGFDDDRILVSDFQAARIIIMNLINKLISKKVFIRPIAIVHLIRDFTSHLTDVEKRTAIDLFISSGAKDVYLWKGEELSDHEIKIKSFFKEGNSKGEFIYSPKDKLYKIIRTKGGSFEYSEK